MANSKRVLRDYQQVPQALRAYDSWICWRLEPRGSGKPAKVPVDPRGRSLKGVPTEAWGVPFEEALACYMNDPALDGIGFVLKSSDPFWFLDIDGRSSVHPEVRQALSRIPSWAEWSQSKQGCHILFADSEAASLRTHAANGYEIYFQGRYVALTGERVEGSPADVFECPGARSFALDVMQVRDEETVVEGAQVAQAQVISSEVVDALRYVNADEYETWIRVGMILRTLGPDWWITWDQWSSNSGKYSGPDSTWEKWGSFSADGGVDRLNIASLFHLARQGGWRGLKFDVTQVFQPITSEVDACLGLEPDTRLFVPASELLARWDTHAVEWTVYQALQRRAVGLVYGPSMTFKTYLLLDLAAHIVLGLPHWHGHPIDRPGPVLFLLGEGFEGFMHRVEAWRQAHNARTGSNVQAQDLAGLIPSRRGVDFKDLASPDLAETERAIREHRPVLVIQDTWSANNVTVNENYVEEVGPVLRLMTALSRNLDCTVLIVHHTPKSTSLTARGTGAFLANVDFQWSMAPAREADPERKVVLTFTKSKASREPAPMQFRPRDQLIMGRLDARGRPVSDLVLDHLGTPAVNVDFQGSGHRRLTDEQKLLYNTVREAIAHVQMASRSAPGITYQDAWEAWVRVPEELRNGSYARDKDMRRAVNRLVNQGALSIMTDPQDGDRVWLTVPNLTKD